MISADYAWREFGRKAWRQFTRTAALMPTLAKLKTLKHRFDERLKCWVFEIPRKGKAIIVTANALKQPPRAYIVPISNVSQATA